MLWYYRYMADLPHPTPARGVYRKGLEGQGWPEHCPPIRSAGSYGWDVLNPFRMRFLRNELGKWEIEEAVEVQSDVDLEGGFTPHPQVNAWFWDKDQKRPHLIASNVFEHISHQVKVSTFLYLKTEEDWMIWIRSIPNLKRSWTAVDAVVESDWYFPAHPLHGVIELPLDESIKEVVIEKDEPLFRLVPVQRSTFEADEMTGKEFGEYFKSGQNWLSEHGKKVEGDDVLLTGVYAKQQILAEFEVNPDDE